MRLEFLLLLWIYILCGFVYKNMNFKIHIFKFLKRGQVVKVYKYYLVFCGEIKQKLHI